MCKCCKAQVCCCFGPAPCSLCCSYLPSFRQSWSTRLMYIVFLTVATLVSCVMLARDVQQILAENIEHFNETCIKLQAGENCNRLVGYLAVYRVGFTMVVFHVVLMIILLCVSTSNDCRAGIQNGFWLLKTLILIGLCAGAFYIPEDEQFSIVWMYVGIVGGFLFILLQMYLIVDFAHVWHRRWSGRAEGGRRVWHGLLYFCATLFILVSCGSAVALYIFYTRHDHCIENKIFVILNIGLCLLMCFISILPCTKKVNANAGILQPALISLYVMYLTWSALISVPATEVPVDLNSHLNVTSNSTRFVLCGPQTIHENWPKVSGYIGALLMLAMTIYATVVTSKKKKVPTATLR